jgi:D-alanyl-D-alanine carboxypeptidase/D-alanyl-D-alanine-endopeptidase (penicillin-binding protein 4)
MNGGGMPAEPPLASCYNHLAVKGRKRAIFLAIFLLIWAAPVAFSRSNKLESDIEKILAQPDAKRGFWGVEVVSLSSGKVLFAHNQANLFTPASNLKLFVTSAALALIGPQYKFQTTVETSGTVDKYGRLTGDVVLVGRGDPNLSGRELPYNMQTIRELPPDQVLEELADQLVQKGVKYIDGDVVGDDSFYAFQRYGEGWSQEDLVSQWGAPVSALTINDNVIFLHILPGDRPG